MTCSILISCIGKSPSSQLSKTYIQIKKLHHSSKILGINTILLHYFSHILSLLPERYEDEAPQYCFCHRSAPSCSTSPTIHSQSNLVRTRRKNCSRVSSERPRPSLWAFWVYLHSGGWRTQLSSPGNALCRRCFASCQCLPSSHGPIWGGYQPELKLSISDPYLNSEERQHASTQVTDSQLLYSDLGFCHTLVYLVQFFSILFSIQMN